MEAFLSIFFKLTKIVARRNVIYASREKIINDITDMSASIHTTCDSSYMQVILNELDIHQAPSQ